ncbi:MAG: gephyrin-like molybdotransferase Glp [Mycobacterium sp.]
MRSVEEHQRVVAGLITAPPAALVPVSAAEGLVLAADVVAPLSLPVFDNSAMDGYAVRAADVSETPVTLPVAEDIPAGRTDRLTLEPGTAHRIMTGAPVPAGADAVVPVEATDAGIPVVEIRSAPKPGQHIRKAGEDVAAGTRVLCAGHHVTPAALGLVAALGIDRLAVTPRQRVLVISTGSELVPPGTSLQPGQIYESNAVMLAAAVREAGAEVAGMATCSDDVAQFRALLDDYAGQADVVLTSGGVSAGAYEVVKDAFGSGSAVEFVKVAMQPGMPQGAGRLSDGRGIITLPGNPVSALVSFEVFIRPALRAAMGLPAHRPRRTAALAEALTSPGGKRQFRRGVYDADSGTVTSYGPPASHHLRWLASANCLLDIGADVTEIAGGEPVTVWDLSQ